MFYGQAHAVYDDTRKGNTVFTLKHICFTVKHTVRVWIAMCLTVKISLSSFAVFGR